MPHHCSRIGLLMLLLVLPLVTACGTASPSVTLTGSEIGTASPVGVGGSVGATPTPTAPAARSDTDTATATAVTSTPTMEPRGGSMVIVDPMGAESLYDLAWFSSVIAVGTVSAHGEAYAVDAFGGGVVATDFTVTVQTLVRGQVADPTTLLVRQYGDAARGCASVMGHPAFAVGDRVLLFLRDLADAPVGAAQVEPFGHQQGVWHLADDDLATSADPFFGSTPLPLPDVLNSIVASLQCTPPTGIVAEHALVPLEESPLVLTDAAGNGASATATATPTAADAPTVVPDMGCNGLISGVEHGFASVSDLAWFSHVIVVGTAISRGEPYVIGNDGRHIIATDYVIAVETPVRGMLDDPTMIKVRQFGGTIGECSQVYEGDPSFAIGDRVLFFLNEDLRGPLDSGRLWPMGHLQGVWHVADDGMVVNTVPTLQTSPQPLDELLGVVVAALQGAPASGPAARHFLVPLGEAPLIFPVAETLEDVGTATPSP